MKRALLSPAFYIQYHDDSKLPVNDTCQLTNQNQFTLGTCQMGHHFLVDLHAKMDILYEILEIPFLGGRNRLIPFSMWQHLSFNVKMISTFILFGFCVVFNLGLCIHWRKSKVLANLILKALISDKHNIENNWIIFINCCNLYKNDVCTLLGLAVHELPLQIQRQQLVCPFHRANTKPFNGKSYKDTQCLKLLHCSRMMFSTRWQAMTSFSPKSFLAFQYHRLTYSPTLPNSAVPDNLFFYISKATPSHVQIQIPKVSKLT